MNIPSPVHFHHQLMAGPLPESASKRVVVDEGLGDGPSPFSAIYVHHPMRDPRSWKSKNPPQKIRKKLKKIKEMEEKSGERIFKERDRCRCRKPAAKEVDAVFSTVAVTEKRGTGGEGGERRQRATGVRDNRIDGRLGSGDGGSNRTRRRDQWRETTTTRPWRQQRTALEEKDVADDAGRGRRGDGGEEAVRKQGKKRRWLGLCCIEKETKKKEEAEVDGCNGELGSRDQRVDEGGDEVDSDGEE